MISHGTEFPVWVGGAAASTVVATTFALTDGAVVLLMPVSGCVGGGGAGTSAGVNAGVACAGTGCAGETVVKLPAVQALVSVPTLDRTLQ